MANIPLGILDAPDSRVIAILSRYLKNRLYHETLEKTKWN